MADCVSLPNAAELVEELRRCADEGYFAPCEMENAADAIERLLAENARLKAERDAYVQILSENAKLKATAIHLRKITTRPLTDEEKEWFSKQGTVYWNDKCDDWEWSGVQKEEEDG